MNQFDAIYVINLRSRADRRKEMQEQLKRVGLGFEHDKVVLFDAVRPDEAGPFPSIGARGCFMSHLGVLIDANKRGLKSVLLLEDDCNFTSDCLARLKSLADGQSAQKWDLLWGGTFSQGFDSSESKDFRQIPSHQSLMATHFVGVQAEALTRLIDYLKAMLERAPGDPRGGPMHVDGAYTWFRKDNPDLVTLLAVPKIATQRASRTDIHSLNWFDRVPVLKLIIDRLRQIKNRSLL